MSESVAAPTEDRVSVVMGVHDHPDAIRKSINSVLAQQGVEYELIIVDDGSDTDVQALLATYRSRPEVAIVRQPNRGLTNSLIKGCDLANNEYIARIDAGDCMLPGRLEAQAKCLMNNPRVGLVTSWVAVTTPEGYPLFTVDYTAADLRAGLVSNSPEKSISPFHASVMMRRACYREAGGYRKEFYFAQDLDLWSRMIKLADIDVIEEVLTTGLFSPSGLSGRYADEQQRLRELIIRLRTSQTDTDQAALLAEAARIRPDAAALPPQGDTFGGCYFIARQLADQGSVHAGDYFRRALRLRPLNLRARLAYWYWLLLRRKQRNLP